MDVHEDNLDLKKGEEERRNSTNIDSFFHKKRDAVYISENLKNGLRKIFGEATSKEKLKIRQWANPNT
jgi:hypothetical protein